MKNPIQTTQATLAYQKDLHYEKFKLKDQKYNKQNNEKMQLLNTNLIKSSVYMDNKKPTVNIRNESELMSLIKRKNKNALSSNTFLKEVKDDNVKINEVSK